MYVLEQQRKLFWSNFLKIAVFECVILIDEYADVSAEHPCQWTQNFVADFVVFNEIEDISWEVMLQQMVNCPWRIIQNQ